MNKMRINKLILVLFFLLSLCFVNGALTDNNIAYYTLNNTLVDSTGNGNILTNHGSTYASGGKINGAYDYHNGYMSSSAFLTNNNVYSINFWIKLTDVTTTQRIFEGREIGGVYTPFDIYVSNGHVFEGRYDGSHYTPITSSSSISINTWYMVTATYSGSNKNIYINSNLVASTTGDTFVGNAGSQTSYLYGVYSNNAQPTQGLIDEISFWDGRTLTSTEISYLYANGNPSTPQQYPYSVIHCDTLDERLANGCLNFEQKTISTIDNYGWTKVLKLNNNKTAILFSSRNPDLSFETEYTTCSIEGTDCSTPTIIQHTAILGSANYYMFEDTTNNHVIVTQNSGGGGNGDFFVLNLNGSVITSKQYSNDYTYQGGIGVQATATDFAILSQNGNTGKTELTICKLDGSSCQSAIQVDPNFSATEINDFNIIKNSNNNLTICYGVEDNSVDVIKCFESSLNGTNFGTKNTVVDHPTSYLNMIEGSDQKLKIVYTDNDLSNYGRFTSCDLDGSNCIAPSTFQDNTTKYNNIYEFNSTLFISTYYNNLYNMGLLGTDLSLPSNFTTNNIYVLDSIITDYDKVLVVYSDNGGNVLMAVSEQLGVPPLGNRTIEQTYTDLQTVPIVLNGTDYIPILSGSFNINQDNIKNYDSGTLQVLSDANNSIVCRTNLDGDNGTDVTRTNSIDIINSMNIFREDSEISTGQHDVTAECKKIGSGNINISRASGVGHILASKSGEIINNKYDNITNIITSNAFYNEIGNTTIETQSTPIGFNKYLVVDWGSEITNQHTLTDESDIQVKIYNIHDLTTPIKTCEEFKYNIPTTSTINMGSSCFVAVDPIETYVVKYYGTGTDMLYNINSHVKEFDLKPTEISSTTLTDSLNTASNYTEIATMSLVNNLPDTSLYIKNSANINSNTATNTTAHFKIKIEGDYTYESQDIKHTAQTIDSDFITEGTIPIPTGNINVKLLAYCDNNNCTITRGELTSYVTETNQLTQKEFNVYAYNRWNQSTINTFEAYTPSSIISTTNGSLTIPTEQDFLDFVVSDGSDYVPLSISNHDTTTDYNASLYQSEVSFRSTGIYTGNYINNFTIETPEGSSSTNFWLIKLYPNLGNYLFNFTFPTYYNHYNVPINITESSSSFTLTNVYDTILNFKNSTNDVIYPSCNWLGNTINGSYLLAIQTQLNDSINCTLLGYLPYVSTVSEPFPKTDTIQMNTSKIVVSIFDRGTGNPLTASTTVTLVGVGSVVTTTGTAEFINNNLTPGTYTISVVTPGYYTEQKVFNFNNEEVADVSLSLLKTSLNSTTTLYVSVLDEFTHAVPNANVKLESYNSEIDGFEEIAQAITNSNGECQFLVELGTKKYRIYASKLINGVLQEQYSTPIGEYFQPDLFNGDPVYQQLVRELVLSTSTKLEAPDFMGLNIDIPKNTSATIQFENESTIITYIPIEFTSENNLDYKICLEYFVDTHGKLTPSLAPVCLKSSSGEVPTYNFSLSKDYTNVAKVTIEENNKKTTYKTYTYPGNNSLWYLLNKNNYVTSFVLIFWIALLSFSLYAKNIGIFCYGADILAILQSGLFPSVINMSGSIMIILISSAILYLVRKQQDTI